MPDGRGMAKAMEYMYPYMLDKKKWPMPPDVMYYNEWPVRQPSLFLADWLWVSRSISRCG